MKTLFIVLVGIVSISGLWASEPIQLSLTPEFAVYDRKEQIDGFCLSLWGENPQSAFALGFVNGSTGDSAGLSIGLVNYADTYTGLQWSFFNYVQGDFSGWQGGPVFGLAIGGVNIVDKVMTGFQCALVNYAGTLNGAQLGLFNYADLVGSGVQIGVINIMPQNAWFKHLPDELAPGMILVNWHF